MSNDSAVFVDSDTRSSGFRFRESYVLTCAHSVSNENAKITVWVNQHEYPATVAWKSYDSNTADIALLEIEGLPRSDESYQLARPNYDSSEHIDDCQCLCFPATLVDSEQPDKRAGHNENSVLLRGSINLDGVSARRTESVPGHRFIVNPATSSMPNPDLHLEDAWPGVSGAAITHGNHILGLVIRYEPSESPSQLHIATFDAIDQLTDAAEFWRLLGYASSEDLPRIPKRLTPDMLVKITKNNAVKAIERLGYSQLTYNNPLRDIFNNLDNGAVPDATIMIVQWLKHAASLTASYLNHVRANPSSQSTSPKGRIQELQAQLDDLRQQLLAIITMPLQCEGCRQTANAATLNEFLVQVDSVLKELANIAYTDFRQLEDKRPINKSSSDETRAAANCCLACGNADLYVQLLIMYCDVTCSGVLMVAGAWGTGKSFECGKSAQHRLQNGLPTLLVLGDDLKRTEPEMWVDQAGQYVSSLCSIDISGENLLNELENEAVATGHTAVLFIDAVNETHGDFDHNIASLQETLKGYLHILCVITRRIDSISQIHNDYSSSSYGTYRHIGIDPDTAWQELKTHLNLPIDTPPFTLNFRKPFMLRMVEKTLLKNNDTTAIPALTVDGLLAEWLTILGDEYTDFLWNTERNHTKSKVARGYELKQVLDSVDGNKPLSPGFDNAIDFLVSEGMLTRDSQSDLRYALQEIQNYRHTEYLLKSDLHIDLNQLINLGLLPREKETITTHEHSPEDQTQILMEVGPRVLKREPVTFTTNEFPKGSLVAFARSLQYRPPNEVYTDTVVNALRLLDSSLASFVWFAAVLNSVFEEHPLGASFIAEQIDCMSKYQRDQRFVVPLGNICSSIVRDSDDNTNRAALESVLLWIDRQAQNASLTSNHAKELSFMVQSWLLLPPSEPSVACARILATLMCHYPDTVPDLFKRAVQLDDLDLLAGTWAALFGAVLRCPAPSSVSEQATKAIQQYYGTLPRHMETLTVVYEMVHFLNIPLPGDDELEMDGEPDNPPPPGPFVEFIHSASRAPLRLFHAWHKPIALEDMISRDWPPVDRHGELLYSNRLNPLIRHLSGGLHFKQLRDSEMVPTDDILQLKYTDQSASTIMAELAEYMFSGHGIWYPRRNMIDITSLIQLRPHYYFRAIDTSPRADTRLRTSSSLQAPDEPDNPFYVRINPPFLKIHPRQLNNEVWWPLKGVSYVADNYKSQPQPLRGKLIDSSHFVDFSLAVPGSRLPVGRTINVSVSFESIIVPASDTVLNSVSGQPQTHIPVAQEVFDMLDQSSHRRNRRLPPFMGRFLRAQECEENYSYPIRTMQRFEQVSDYFTEQFDIPTPELRQLLDASWTGDGINLQSADGQPLVTWLDPLSDVSFISAAALQLLASKRYRLLTSIRVVDRNNSHFSNAVIWFYTPERPDIPQSFE